METLIECYVRLKNEKEEAEEVLKETRQPFLDEIGMIEEHLKKATKYLTEVIEAKESQLRNLNVEILNTWDNNGPATVELQDGTKVVRSAMKSIEVLKRKELLGTLLSLIPEDDKLPFTVKWTDKGLIPLLDANIIPPELATINTTFRLSVRKPKD